MELIRGHHNIRARHHCCVLTIGNFDGIHLGHQALIKQLTTLASTAGLPSMLMLFEPQPQEFFAGNNAPARLTRLREKLHVLGTTAVDKVLCVRFSRDFANQTAEHFIEALLVKRLGIQTIVVGDDFRFGRNGAGNRDLLRLSGERYGFQTVTSTTHQLNGRRVSSSWVREALAQGQMELVTQLLGRRYSIQGRVARGDRIGRTLGYPTANIPLRRQVVPLVGVYATQVLGLATEPLASVAYVGSRPTLDGVDVRLEVHLFDFDADIYGRAIEVEFLQQIRGDQRFDSMDQLKMQMDRDAAQAKTVFGNGANQAALPC